MNIDAQTHANMPPHLKALFNKLPNPVTEGFPVTTGGRNPSGVKINTRTADGTVISKNCYGGFTESTTVGYNEGGSAARFFYTAKSSRLERNAGCEGLEEGQASGGGGMNNTPDDVCGKYGSIKAKATNCHPTVKPLSLTKYLATLILPPPRDTPRKLLVPYSGSGSEMIGGLLAGWDHVTGIEYDTEHGYVAIAEARLAFWLKAIEKYGTPLDPAAVLGEETEKQTEDVPGQKRLF